MKKMIIIGAVLFAVGTLICGTTSAVSGLDLNKFNHAEYVTNTYPVNDNFSNIDIRSNIEDVSFVLSTDGKCSVVCVEEKKNPHNVRVEGDMLKVDRNNNTKLSLQFGFSTQSEQITVYLPEKDYENLNLVTDTGNADIRENFSFTNITAELDTGDISCLASVKESVTIKTNTGNITATNITANNMNLSSDTGEMYLTDIALTNDLWIHESTGNVKMENISCKTMTSDGDTGDLNIKNVVATEKFDLKRSTGNIEFDSCDAESIFVMTDTGNISGTLLTDKIFFADSKTGDENVPKTITGGRCEINSDTGDINISVK